MARAVCLCLRQGACCGHSQKCERRGFSRVRRKIQIGRSRRSREFFAAAFGESRGRKSARRRDIYYGEDKRQSLAQFPHIGKDEPKFFTLLCVDISPEISKDALLITDCAVGDRTHKGALPGNTSAIGIIGGADGPTVISPSTRAATQPARPCTLSRNMSRIGA